MARYENHTEKTRKLVPLLGKPFLDILDYWITVFGVADKISDTEKNAMLAWITSNYEQKKSVDAFSRIYYVRKVLLANVTRKGWKNPYEDTRENNTYKKNPEYKNDTHSADHKLFPWDN